MAGSLDSKELACQKLLYEEKRNEFKRFVEAAKLLKGNRDHPLESAKRFVPVFAEDTNGLVEEIKKTGGKQIVKDIVTFEENPVTLLDLLGESESNGEKKKQRAKRKGSKRRQRRLKQEHIGADGLVNVEFVMSKRIDLSAEKFSDSASSGDDAPDFCSPNIVEMPPSVSGDSSNNPSDNSGKSGSNNSGSE